MGVDVLTPVRDWTELVKTAPEFVLGQAEEDMSWNEYVPLNSKEGEREPKRRKRTQGEDGEAGKNGGESKLRKIYDKPVHTQWVKIIGHPAGLHNRGNTCFLNSVLQILAHIPPLVEFLQEQHPQNACKTPNCILCDFKAHLDKALSTRIPFAPKSMLGRLRHIGKQFSIGRQEDAHEFLRLLIDSFQRSALPRATTLDEKTKQTTVIYQIFGGTLKQEVSCLSCGHVSETIQPIMDISVDVGSGRGTVSDSLAAFCSKERLSRGNRYRCTKCSKLVDATKQTHLYTPPKVLTLHLKRFAYTLLSTAKVSKKIGYPMRLDIAPYTVQDANNSSPPQTRYNLCGVIVHLGKSARSGHYYSFAKASNGVWHQFDDENVTTARAETVLDQQAYMLYYLQEQTPIIPAMKENNNSSPPSKTARPEKSLKSHWSQNRLASLVENIKSPDQIPARTFHNRKYRPSLATYGKPRHR